MDEGVRGVRALYHSQYNHSNITLEHRYKSRCAMQNILLLRLAELGHDTVNKAGIELVLDVMRMYESSVDVKQPTRIILNKSSVYQIYPSNIQ